MIGATSRTLRFHERNQRSLCGRLRDHVQVERQPGVAICRERHTADHRDTKPLFREKPLDNVQLAREVHGV